MKTYGSQYARSVAFMLLLLIALAVGLRWPHLGQRPMHNDEAVNAVKFCQFLEQGAYVYDSNEFHGPSLWYATFVLARLTGAPDFEHFSEVRLRALPVLFGLGLVLLLPLVLDGLGRRGTLWAGLFTAVSPAMVFYSRYYIHEMLLVFFTFLALAAGWRYWRSRKLGWALLAGAGFGLMHSTKETFVIALLAAAGALILSRFHNRLLNPGKPPVQAPPLCGWHLLAGFGVWLFVWLLLFSALFTHPQGLLDSFLTYAPWFERAGGDSAHNQPWHFYFHRLLFFHAGGGPVWTEALILPLAMIGGAAGFIRQQLGRTNGTFVRFLALYTFLLAAAYCDLSYKTPWCLLGFWHGTILLAGVGAAVLLRNARKRVVRLPLALLLLAGAGHLGWQAWRVGHAYAADEHNPYAYAHTSPEILPAMERVEALARISGQSYRMPIKIIASDGDYWPLPWYLRRFKQVIWCNEVPADPFASVMLVSADFHATLDKNKSHVLLGCFQLRPEFSFELYVEAGLWKRWQDNYQPKTQ